MYPFTKPRFLFVLALGILLSLTSCIHKECRVQVENRTPYRIDSLRIGMQTDDRTLSLQPGQTSDVLSFRYAYHPGNLLFAEGGLSLQASHYTVGDSLLKNRFGIFVTASSLSGKEVNRYTLILNTDTTEEEEYRSPFVFEPENHD